MGPISPRGPHGSLPRPLGPMGPTGSGCAERPDGTRIPFLPYPTPLFDASGALIGAVNMLVDITERREAEQRIHDSEARYRDIAAIVESSEDAVVAKNLDSIITSWNRGAERLFGYTAKEAIGKPITMLIPPDRRDEESNIIARIRRGERVEPYETIRQRNDGPIVEISLTISPVRNPEGQILGARRSPATSASAGRRRNSNVFSSERWITASRTQGRFAHALVESYGTSELGRFSIGQAAVCLRPEVGCAQCQRGRGDI